VYARRAAGALALAAAVTLLAGCDTSGGADRAGGAAGSAGPGASSAPQQAPRDELAAGVRATAATSYSFVTKAGNVSVEGVSDGARRVGRTIGTSKAGGRTARIETVVIGTDVYFRVVGEAFAGVPAGKFARLDASRLTSLRNLGMHSTADPSGLLAIVDALGTVERTAPRTFRGDHDLSKRGAAASLVKALGDQATRVPFEARLDERGRLSWIAWTVPAVAGSAPVRMETTFSALGGPVVVDKPPAAEVVEAPPRIYQLFEQ